MAKVNNKGMVSGKVGAVVYRRYRNMNIIQAKPRKFKQTVNSICASAEFGLASSAAAVIRRAFEPAYIHRDGTAASRSTQSVYRSIRNSSIAEPGRRDLHDANLDELVGMDFNADSRLSQVLQVNHSVYKLENGNIKVRIGAFNSQTSIKRPAGFTQRGYKCRIRLMLIAFNFREEYLEYADVKDIDFYNYKNIPEQCVVLQASSDQSCIQILSMSVMLYDQMGPTGDYVLLNSRSFSPCAIIAAYPAENPSLRIAEPADLTSSTFQNRIDRIGPMGYAGNEILRNLNRRCQHQITSSSGKQMQLKAQLQQQETSMIPALRKKISFTGS